ncbi:hypothetical protein BKA63DRAFT_582333 [Paraphoma chrysanthemicola]|nr:hypothetical protein BKA63DRAFT_582333 [Paraphoma chrysanthemicola]
MAHKHLADAIGDAVISQTPDKRQRADNVASEQVNNTREPQDGSRDGVACQTIAPKLRPSQHQPEPSAQDSACDFTFKKEYGEEHLDMDPVLLRIYNGIRYSRAQLRKNLPIMQTTHFTIPVPPDTPADGTALVLLRRAEEDGFATFVLESSFHIVFELGMPVPYVVPEGAGVRLIHDPQWWAGKSAAEVKAGPHAEAKDVRRAEGNLKGLATRNEKKAVKSKRQREMEEKLREGLRRQDAKGKMCDSDEDGERVWSETETESEVEGEIGEDDAGLDRD